MPHSTASAVTKRLFHSFDLRQLVQAMLCLGLLALGLPSLAQPVPGISLAWPVPTVARTNISQGFAQYGSGSATKFHAGIDIAGALDTNVVAAAGGVARVILLSDSSWANKTKCMGNVVILDHGSVSTLYAHLNSISVTNGQSVSAGQVIGKIGRSVGLTAAGGNCVTGQSGNNGPVGFEHLHFELKLYPVLGSDNDLGPPNIWGYTPAAGTSTPTLNDEPTQFNYRNPVLNMHGGITSLVQLMTVTSVGGGVSLRHGPGTDYAPLGSKSVAGEKYISMNVLNSATSGCSLGWVQVRRQSGSFFTDTNGGSNPTAWICQGNAGETWVAADTVSYALTVNRSGSGSGTVTSSPAGISCGSDCSESLAAGSSITLSATASAGSSFAGWSGGNCSGTGTCTVTLNSAVTVTASFTANPVNYSLSVNRSGSGQGSVGSAPAGISCGSSCNASFPAGTMVTLSAVASAGSAFGSWSGVGCSGGNLGAACSFALNADTSVTANFDSANVAIHDFNDDGRSDLLWRNTSDGAVQGWIMNGLSASQIAGLLPAGGYSVSHIADLNGDGKSDLLIRHVDGTLIAWLHDGLNVVEQKTLTAAGAGWSVSHTADLNGDGRSDLILENADGTVVGWLMNGLVVTSTVTFVPAGSGWSLSRVGDLNGDGRADLLWQHSAGAVQAWLMDGLSATQVATFVGSGSGWSIKLVADFNGDGKSDLIWQHTDGSAQAWLMNGLGISQIASFVPAGTGWSPVLAGDINGDGKDDLFWEHNGGRSQTWLMDGLSVTGIASFVGSGNWRATHLLDLDGDGRRDVLWRHADGTVQAWLLDGLTVKQIASLARSSQWEVTPPRP